MTEDEFWANVEEVESGCWEWQMSLDNYGYGMVRIKNVLMKAHKAAWRMSGQKDLKPRDILHHKCGNRKCVRPEHLEVTNRREHADSACGVNASKTHCPKGHPYIHENTYINSGYRKCRVCARDRYWGVRVPEQKHD